MIHTTDEKVLLESDEPAFMVLGATSYETPGDTPDAVKKTTVFTLRINEAMNDELNELCARCFNAPSPSREEALAIDVLFDFRRSICERVCSKHAEFSRIGDEVAVIVWKRVELKGGKR